MVSSKLLSSSILSLLAFYSTPLQAVALPGTQPPHTGCQPGAIACSSRNPIEFCTFIAQIAPGQTTGQNWLGNLDVYVYDQTHSLVGHYDYTSPQAYSPKFVPFTVADAKNNGTAMVLDNLFLVVNSFTPPTTDAGWNGDLTWNFGKNQYNQKNKNMQCQQQSNGQTGNFYECFVWFDCGAAA